MCAQACIQKDVWTLNQYSLDAVSLSPTSTDVTNQLNMQIPSLMSGHKKGRGLPKAARNPMLFHDSFLIKITFSLSLASAVFLRNPLFL